MKHIIIFLYTTLVLFAANTTEKVWQHDYPFGAYMEDNNISFEFLDEISNDDLVLLSEIQEGTKYYESKEQSKLMQTLIPIGKEMQIHIFRDITSGDFKFDIIPIAYKEIDDEVLLKIDTNFKNDLLRKLKNPTLVSELSKIYRHKLKLSKLKKGDKVSLLYTQRSRLGKAIDLPHITAALIEHKGKKYYRFLDTNDHYYSDIFKKIGYTEKKKILAYKSKYFTKPIKKMRITSKFTYKRWHPILKRYRPHLGIDIGAKRGTNIYATNDGKVVFSGWLGGYGRAIKIKHKGGYLSLYAHQSKLLAKKGQRVKNGQVIGRVGSTGRSTGPHLHFGLYKHGKPVSPVKYIGKKKLGKDRTITKKYTKYKVLNIKNAKKNKKIVTDTFAGREQGFVFEMYNKSYDVTSAY